MCGTRTLTTGEGLTMDMSVAYLLGLFVFGFVMAWVSGEEC